MYLSLPNNLIIQINYKTYSFQHTYNEINNSGEIQKLLTLNEDLPKDVADTLKSLVSSVKKRLSDFGLNNTDNVSFYYLDKESYCCSFDLESMFDDVDNFDYLKPIQKLKLYFTGSEPNYYDNLLKKYNTNTLPHPLYITDFDYDLDEILLQYVKCIPDIHVMITWAICNINDIYKTNFYDILNKNGKIHAIKELKVTMKQIQGIIYQAYYDKKVFKSFDAVRGKAKMCSTLENKIYIIFYTHDGNEKISGTDATFKVKLRKILKQDSGNTQNFKDNLYLHITDNNTNSIELTQLFCNKNSMRLLQYQRLDRILQKNFDKSLAFLMTYKNWLYSMIHPLDHIRFMLFSSIVLYSLGLRNINDIDMIIHYLPSSDNTKSESFFEKIYTYLENDKTKFPFVVDGASIKGRNGWIIGGEKEYLINWFEKEWPAMYGSISMDDTILNPKFHYYYFGLKIISVEADIKRRGQRSRPAAYADLIAMQKLVYNNVVIPKIPNGYWKNHVFYEFSNKEKKELINKTIFYLRNRYGILTKNYEIEKIIL
jgi:hypothetical protein